MRNNNKRKRITGCVAGAILLLFAAVLVACSKDNNGNVEVASITEDVNTDGIDENMSGDTSVEQENTESVEKEADKDIAENETDKAETEESNTEEPTENTETSNKEETANTESNNTEPAANKTVTTSSNWGTPQEYYGDPVNQRLAVASDGIGEFDAVGAQFWRIRRVNDYWELRMNSVPEEFRWDGIHQVLRYLSPDGDLLYQLIYDDVYTGRIDIMPEYDEWYSYQNSQVMVHDTTDMGYMIYYFK